MVLTGLKLGVNKLVSMYGHERTQQMYAASLASIDCVEQIVREENIACDFARCGHLEVACKQKHFDDYARQAGVIARGFNHQLRVVPRHELPAEIGSSIYYGGMVDEVSAGLNPARYVAGLGCAAMRAGAAIFENAQVQHIERLSRNGASEFRVTTSRGALWARNVFAGTSGYTGAATPALRKKIIPIGSYIITTEVLSDVLARELSPRNRMIYDSKHYLYYYRLTPDRRMLFGWRAAFFPETADTIRRCDVERHVRPEQGDPPRGRGRFQPRVITQSQVRHPPTRKQPRGETENVRLAVIDFYAAKNRRKNNCCGEPYGASRDAKRA